MHLYFYHQLFVLDVDLMNLVSYSYRKGGRRRHFKTDSDSISVLSKLWKQTKKMYSLANTSHFISIMNELDTVTAHYILSHSIVTFPRTCMSSCWLQVRNNTHLQHCFLMFRPPNLGLSRQLVHSPQSSGTWQPEHWPQRRDRRPFLGGASWTAFCRVSRGFMGGDWGSASSEPATEDLSVKKIQKRRISLLLTHSLTQRES